MRILVKVIQYKAVEWRRKKGFYGKGKKLKEDCFVTDKILEVQK